MWKAKQLDQSYEHSDDMEAFKTLMYTEMPLNEGGVQLYGLFLDEQLMGVFGQGSTMNTRESR
jgi:hypothetical protein